MLLPDLRIKNYRLFKEFEIERLARVNLIAGWNNAGKSSLLEAAYLVSNKDLPSALNNVLRFRGESNGKGKVVSQLFYGYRLSPGLFIEISSGEEHVRFSILEREESERMWEEVPRYLADRLMQLDESRNGVHLMQVDSSGDRAWKFVLLGERGLAHRILEPGLPQRKESNRVFLLPGDVSLYSEFGETSEQWDTVSLTPRADTVIEALQIIDAKVKDLDFLRAEDNVKVLLEGIERPILIGSLGDGVRHLMMVALSLVNARDGVLLIDEIDTGLHYTTLTDLWRLIFKTARHLNVQVLATTHSWDCIAAFSQAWNEVEESEGLFFRLSRRGDKIKPVIYTAEGLGIAVEQEIEVR